MVSSSQIVGRRATVSAAAFTGRAVPPPKPKRQTKKYLNEAFEYAKNRAKWKAAEDYCADRMWEFKVMTEKELGIK